MHYNSSTHKRYKVLYCNIRILFKIKVKIITDSTDCLD